MIDPLEIPPFLDRRENLAATPCKAQEGSTMSRNYPALGSKLTKAET